MSLQARTKDLKFGRSPVHAWGLFARDTIPAEEFLIEYVGELIRSSLEDIREATYERSGVGSSYLFRVDKDQVVDATKRVCPSIHNPTPVVAPVRTPLCDFSCSSGALCHRSCSWRRKTQPVTVLLLESVYLRLQCQRCAGWSGQVHQPLLRPKLLHQDHHCGRAEAYRHLLQAKDPA